MMRNYGEKKKKKFKQNLGWGPNDKKPNDQRINRDRTQDGVPMMRNRRNKKKFRQNLGQCPNDNEKPNEKMIKYRQNLGWCSNDEKPKDQTIKL